MSDLFRNQLHINVGIRPGCHYFLKCLEVILISSQGGKLLANEVFPVKKVQLLAETQGWERRDLSLPLHQEAPKATASTPAFLLSPAILFSRCCVSASTLPEHTLPWLSNAGSTYLCGGHALLLCRLLSDPHDSLIWFPFCFSHPFLPSLLHVLFFL